MKWVWRFTCAFVALSFVANFLGLIFDDWRLDKFDTIFACFVVVLWAVEKLLDRERAIREGE